MPVEWCVVVHVDLIPKARSCRGFAGTMSVLWFSTYLTERLPVPAGSILVILSAYGRRGT